MSVQLLAWAWDQQVGSPTEKSVLVALANRANHDSGQCNPSLKRVAEETELSYPTVKRAAASLVDKGFITRQRKRRADGSLSGYAFCFPGITEIPPGLTVIPSPGVTVIPQEPEEDLEPEEVLATSSRNGSPRKRNPIWDALTEVFGEATTTSAKNRRGKVCKSLAAARASPEDVIRRARSWPRHFDDATLTDTALEKHWDTLGREPLRANRS